MEFQLNLLKDNDMVSLLLQKVEDLQKEQGNLRRGIFARHTALQKIIEEQTVEIENLKKERYSKTSHILL